MLESIVSNPIVLGIIANALYDLTKGEGRLADVVKNLDEKLWPKLEALNEPAAKVFQDERHRQLIAKLEAHQTEKTKQSLIAVGEEFGRILSLKEDEVLQEGISVIWENFEQKDSMLIAEMLMSGFASLNMEISEMKALLEDIKAQRLAESKAQQLALNAPAIEVHLEKLFTEDGNTYRSRVSTANGQEIITNDFEYHPEHLVHLEMERYFEKEIRREKPDVLRNLKTDGVPVDREGSLISYGKRLYGYLFGDGKDFSSFLKFDKSYRNGACLNIQTTNEAAELLCVPWEYLHDGEQALALNGKFFVQRTPLGLEKVEIPRLPRPLKILVVVSSPTDAAELNTEKEIAVIQDALDDAVRLGTVKLDFLEEATLENLRLALRTEEYHVLHYTGHGGWDAEKEVGVLVLEKDDGTSDAATVADLQTAFSGASSLRLVVLSGCMTAKTSEQDAFSGVATGLLRNGLPAAVAMQFPILDESGIELARAFYTSLGKGKSVEETLFLARLAMKDRKDGPKTDWGVPALYLRTSGMRLIAPTAKPKEAEPEVLKNYGGLPLPKGFAGRVQERRQIRAALRDKDKTVVYVRGIGGIGKSSVAAKILERPGVELDGMSVISCDRENLTFGEVLQKLASFIQGRVGSAKNVEAAQILLDSGRDISERVFDMAELISNRRYLFVFDNFETLMESVDVAAGSVPPCCHGGATLRWRVKDEELREFFNALLRARWRSTCLFTCRYGWEELSKLPAGSFLEIELPALTRGQALMLMNNLPRLQNEKLPDKLAAYKKVGGHPKTIELLEGFLADHTLAEVLSNEEIGEQLTQEWEQYFLRTLLEQLSEDERKRLAGLCVFSAAFGLDAVKAFDGNLALMNRLRSLSLAQQEVPTPEGKSRYSIHPVVREGVFSKLSKEDKDWLHLQAAEYYEARIKRQDARNEVEGMQLALEWRSHLFAAGFYEKAVKIVGQVWEILDRWGHRDLAKDLLRQSIVTLKSANKAVAQGNLATLLADEGRLDEALQTYEVVYQIFEALNTKQQMAAVLNQQGNIYRLQENYEQAIAKYEASLKINRGIENEKGQAISLHQLSMIYHIQGGQAAGEATQQLYEKALQTSEEGIEIAQKLGNDQSTAAMLHQQGLTLIYLSRRDEAYQRFVESLQIKERINDQSGKADTLGEIGRLLRDIGQLGKAVDAFNRALEIRQRLGYPQKIGISLEHLGIVHELQEEYDAALEKYGQALTLYRQYYQLGVPNVERHITRVRSKMELMRVGR